MLSNSKKLTASCIILALLVLNSCQTYRGDKDLVSRLIPSDSTSYVLLNAYLDRELCRASLLESGLAEAIISRVDQIIIAQNDADNLIVISGDLPTSLVRFGLKSAGFVGSGYIGEFEVFQNPSQELFITLVADNVMLSSSSRQAMERTLSDTDKRVTSEAFVQLMAHVDQGPILYIGSDLPSGAPFASFGLELAKSGKSYEVILGFGTLDPTDSKSQGLRSIVRFAAISVFGAFSGEASSYDLGDIASSENSIKASATFDQIVFSFKKLNDLVKGLKL